MGERSDAAVHHRSGGVDVGMAADADVGPEREVGRVTSGVDRSGSGEGDAPGDTIGIGAEGERDPFGGAGAEIDHLRTGGGDVERNLAGLGRVEPPDPARPTVDVDRAAGQIGLQSCGPFEELGDGHRGQAEVEEGRVTPPGSEHEPAAGDLVDRGGRRRQCRGVARVDVGDAGRELESLGGAGDGGEHDERVGAQVLGVGERDPVPSRLLGSLRPLGRAADDRHRHRPHLHGFGR